MEKRTIQSIDRAIAVLNYIAHHGNNVRLMDMANDLGLKKSTLHGILQTLEVGAMVQKNKESNRYSLGIKLYEFGKVYEQDFSIKKVVRPFLELLSEEFGESVHLAMESNSEVLYIDRINSMHQVRMVTEIGKTDPLYCTAIGKLILSYMDESDVDEYLERFNLVPRTKNTIIDHVKLKEELISVKSQSFSVDNEELEVGMICCAAPITDLKGNLIAIMGMSGPTTRMTTDQLSNMKAKIVPTAKEVSRILSHGY